MCIGFIELMEGERIAPGDVIEMTITLLAFPAGEPEMRQGQEWRIQEGAQLLAIGKILRVFD